MLKAGRRLAARSVECVGDLRTNANAAVVLADWLLAEQRDGRLPRGMFGPLSGRVLSLSGQRLTKSCSTPGRRRSL